VHDVGGCLAGHDGAEDAGVGHGPERTSVAPPSYAPAIVPAPPTATGGRPDAAPPPGPDGVPALYGLDIETDTAVDGLDPRCSAVVSVAVVGPGVAAVLEGDEATLLRALDDLLAGLEPGILVTWNGAAFDLPFLADRAALHGVRLGLRLRHDPRGQRRGAPLAGHPGAYRAAWHGHRHLDGFRVYRADVGAALGLPCGLKAMARLVGLDPVEVDRTQIHQLDAATLRAYVLSDAVLAAELVRRRWPTAQRSVDVIAGPLRCSRGPRRTSA
jgi:hypothetical protein